jgi:hypothetical protein
MPTQTSRPSAPAIGYSRTSSIVPLAIAAGLALALHLVSAIMLDRSHASPGIEPAALAAIDDEVTCTSQTRPQESSLPYD